MRGGDLGFAELRGPKIPLYLLGAKLYAFASISPLYSGCGLMFSASTYGDRLGLTFTADRNMMPDPESMRACIVEAMEAVRLELLGSRDELAA